MLVSGTIGRVGSRAATGIAFSSPATLHASIRGLSTTSLRSAADGKSVIANVAQLRKLLPGTSMVKAREALTSTGNDVQEALKWLEKDLQVSGAKKASKVSERDAKEGGVSVCIVADGAPTTSGSESLTLAARAGIVELNCETDFVGRNEIFQGLLADLAHTVALFPTLAMEEVAGAAKAGTDDEAQGILDIPVEQLLEFPLVPRPQPSSGDASDAQSAPSSHKLVKEAILDVITRLGERIHLARASSLSNVAIPAPHAPRRSSAPTRPPWFVSSAFTHGGASVAAAAASAQGPQVFTGRVGALLLTRVPAERRDEASLKALRGLTRSLARQTAGMPTQSIGNEQGVQAADQEEGSVLYDQPFIMKLAASKLPESTEGPTEEGTVRDSLRAWGSAWTKANAASQPVDVVALRRWQVGESV